jgi:SAM-dependent methyltransferase
MSYDTLLRSYNLSDDLELEFRFVIKDRILFKKLIQSIKGEKIIEQSINFLTIANKTNRICKLLFVNGKKTSKTFHSKTSIKYTKMIDGAMPFKLNISKELDIPDFDVNLSLLARVKLRLSIYPTELPEWRLDFTLVKTVHNIKNNLKSAKNALLYAIDIDDFVNQAPWDHSPEFEFEVEHIGDKTKLVKSDFEKIIQFVHSSADPKYKNRFMYQEKIHQIAAHVVNPKQLDDFKQSKGIRALYNRVLELNRSEFYKKVFPNMKNFYLLDKADGVRTLLQIEGSTMYALNSDLKTIPLTKSYPSLTLIDAEYIEKTAQYYVFDILVFEGKNLTKLPTSARVQHISDAVAMGEGHLVQKNIISLSDDYKNELTQMLTYSKTLPYHTDGLIFTPKNAQYRKMESWKWKPLSDMSIDFLVKKSTPGLLGVSPYIQKPNHTMLFLFCGINKQLYDKLRIVPVKGYKKIFPRQTMYNYFPIQFCPSDNPFAYIYQHPNDSVVSVDDILNSVCEFRRDGDKWIFMRIRTDRNIELERGNYFGNGFYVAEYTWLNYQNPLLFNDMILSNSEYMDMGYFKEEKSQKHKAATAFNSFVKGKLLTGFKGSTWLIDLAAGKGQDMFRVSNANINNALFIDNDAQALSELVSRKHDFQRGIKRLNTRIFTKLINLNDDYKKNIDAIKQIGVPVGGIDVIMCNFAIHYLIPTPASIRNLIYLIKSLLKPGGHFFFTSFDGQSVFNKLIDGDWNVREGEVLKYSIKKKYKSNTIMPTGQQVDVLLPFSKGEYYTEYLVNYEYLIKQFNINGFTTEKTGNFNQFLKEFKDQKNYKNLNADDIEFIKLYAYTIFRKKQDTKTQIIDDSNKQTNNLITERKKSS